MMLGMAGSDEAVVLLVHSPVCGPSTWRPAAAELRARGRPSVVAALSDRGPEDEPLWRRHAISAVRALEPISLDRAVILAGHSGAGALLPAIASLLEHDLAGTLFVDAGIPEDGLSRLDLIAGEAPELARELGALLAGGGVFPDWSEEELRDELPDSEDRVMVLEEVRPRGREYWEEAIPVPEWWPGRPCAYLRLSAAYDVSVAAARARGWPVRELDGGHFRAVSDPDVVAREMLALIDELERAAAAGEPDRRP
jgi:hypothetical protein